MKKLVMICLIGLFAYNLNAQIQHETLFGKSTTMGLFVAPITEFSISTGNAATFAGGGGAIVIDNMFFGAYGLGASNFTDLINETERVKLDMGHGGFWLGYVHNQYKMLHVFSSAKIGWGGLNVEFDDSELDYGEKIFVVTPEVGLEANIFKFLRISGTVGYRFVNGVDSNINYKDSEFSGMVGGVNLRFGWFGNAKKLNWKFWED